MPERPVRGPGSAGLPPYDGPALRDWGRVVESREGALSSRAFFAVPPPALILSSLAAEPAIPSELLVGAIVLFGLLLAAVGVVDVLRRSRRLRRIAKAERERTAFLAEAGPAMSDSLDLDSTLLAVARQASRVMGELCAVLLNERESDTLCAALVYDARCGRTGTPQATPNPAELDLERGFFGRALDAEEPLLVRETEQLRRLFPAEPAARTVLAAPLRVGDQVIGVLAAACIGEGSWPGVDDLRLAALLADRAAVAIEHARTHRALQELADSRSHELRETQRQLLETERAQAIAELAAMVAHEIRNPLNVIQTVGYSLSRQLDGQDVRLERQIRLIMRQVHHAADLIQDLMDYGMFPPPQPALVHLPEVVGELVQDLPSTEGVELRAVAAPDVSPVRCDREQIRRAIRNLVLNAVQSIEDSGTVTVSVSARRGRVIVEVVDTGRGIPEEHRARVYSPLFSTRTRGSGLGLTLTRRIFEENGGGIDFRSEVGHGTTFQAWLPAAAPPSRSAPGPLGLLPSRTADDAEDDEDGEGSPRTEGLSGRRA